MQKKVMAVCLRVHFFFGQPCISQINADLIDVCKHVLEQANANNRNADLVIAKANRVKDEIKKLRNNVGDFLSNQITSNTT